MIKKVIQQGRSDFDARSVLPVREHDKMARTLLVAFFNIPLLNASPSAVYFNQLPLLLFFSAHIPSKVKHSLSFS
ncbi:MAG: hypothetical protein ACQ9IQ_07415 [Nitrospirales bacterium]